jgi:hypothetical protein
MEETAGGMEETVPPKLAITWMLVIGAMGPLIRADAAARAKLAKGSPSVLARAEALRARASLLLLLPIILAAVCIIFVVFLLAFVCALYMAPLAAIWILLLLLPTVHYPVNKLWKCLGVPPETVNTDGFEKRSTKLLLSMSEGPLFKFYFTCSLHTAAVVLQLFVQFNAMISSLGLSYWQAVALVYKHYLGLTTISIEASLPAIDLSWWTDFSNVISLDGIDIEAFLSWPIDLSLVLACKLTYVLGIAMLVLEKCMDCLEALMVILMGTGQKEKTAAPKLGSVQV